MELGEPKTFVTVAAEHSFSLAAIKLCRTQPAVSHPGLVVIPLLAARAASALTLVYRDNDRRPNAVEDLVEVLRSTGEDCVSRKAPIALRVSR